MWIASHSIADGGAVGVLLGEIAAVYGALVDRPGPPGTPSASPSRPGCARRSSRWPAGSPFMVLLAAYQGLLARLSALTDVAVALPLACRDDPAFENVVGSLTNTVALRTRVGGDDSFATVVGRVKDAVLGAMEHQSLPFGKLVEELRPVRKGRTNPIVETVFSYGGTPATRSWTPFGDTLRAACRGMSNDTVRFDFELVLDETLEGLVARFEYDRDRIDARSAQQICDAYLGVLRAVTGRP
ncbi:condensation domain-containing protein [Streptomyces syringium]